MKKSTRLRTGNLPCRRQILLIMKLSTFFLFLALQVSATNYGQRVLNLDEKDITIAEVLRMIEKQSHFSFYYSSNVLPTEKLISISVKKARIEEVMNKILDGTELYWKEVDRNNIVINAPTSSVNASLTGKVIDADGNPITGVSVIEKGTNNGTITNAEGVYALSVRENAVIVFSAVGYNELEIQLDAGQQVLNITLNKQDNLLSEVLVTGYGGTQSRTKTTASISKVDTTIFKNFSGSNAARALSGAVPGLRVVQNSGAPTSIPNIIIRGGTSIDGGGAPLIIVDGMIRGDFFNLNPDEIESMDILKDAGATAIYGARAANGVVLITTKRGKAGKSEINAKVRNGYSFINNTYNFLNGEDYLYWLRVSRKRAADLGYTNTAVFNTAEAFGAGNTYFDANGNQLNPNLNGNALWTPMYLNANPKNASLLNQGWKSMKDPINPDSTIIYKEYNYADIAFKNPARTQDYNISASGGNDKGHYYAGLGYYYEEGMPISTFYRRLNLTFNGDYKLTNWLTSTTNFKFYDNKWKDAVFSDYATYFGRYSSLPPVMNAYTPTGELAMGRVDWEPNPIYINNKYVRDNGSNLYNIGQALKFDLLRGLTFNVAGQWNIQYNIYENFNKDHYASPGNYNTDRSSSATLFRYKTESYNAVLNYKRSFKDHNIDFMAGSEYLNYYDFYLYGGGSGAPTDDFMDLGNTSVNNRNIDTYHQRERVLGFFSRLNYDYKSTYLLSLIGRRDGYSKLLADNRWDFFPGVSAGWVISNEGFMDNYKHIFNFLKLRAGYGDVGDASRIGRYELQGSYNLNSYGSYKGFYYGSLPNPSLQWEHTITKELGLDMGLFKNAITATLTYFDKNTYNKISTVTFPYSSGKYTALSNNGIVNGRGFELETRFNIIRQNDLNWWVSANASWNKIKIVELPNNGLDNNRQGGQQIWDPATGKLIWVGGYQQGQEPGQIYAYRAKGIYRNANDVKNYADTLIDKMAGSGRYNYGPAAYAKLTDKSKGFPIQPGDVIWDDINKDGIIDQYDQVYVGNSIPRWMGGLSSSVTWKGISLFIRTDFALKYYQMDNILPFFLGIQQGSFNSIDLVKETWTPENPNAKYPMVYWADQNGKKNYSRPSTMLAYEASYIALRELMLSYRLPLNISKKITANNIEVFVNGQDLGYITKSKMYTPEQGGGVSAGYPLPRKINFGINLTF